MKRIGLLVVYMACGEIGVLQSAILELLMHRVIGVAVEIAGDEQWDCRRLQVAQALHDQFSAACTSLCGDVVQVGIEVQ